MDQRTSDRDTGVTTEFERDVVKLLLETMRAVAKQERADVGTEGLLYALVSGEWAAGSAIAPGMKASGSLGGSIAGRGTSVWISGDAGDGATGSPDDEREIDAFWREVRQEEAKRLRWKNRKEEEPENFELPPMTAALRACLRKALEAAREEGTVSVRVRHVAQALAGLPDTRAREAMVVEWRSWPMAGRATFTMEVLSTTRNCAPASRERTWPGRCGGGTGVEGDMMPFGAAVWGRGAVPDRAAHGAGGGGGGGTAAQAGGGGRPPAGPRGETGSGPPVRGRCRPWTGGASRPVARGCAASRPVRRPVPPGGRRCRR